jgi:hypothetical protein
MGVKVKVVFLMVLNNGREIKAESYVGAAG